MSSVWHRHVWANRFQTALLMLFMLAILAALGDMLFGADGLWLTLAAGAFALVLAPSASSRLTLRLYRAQPIPVEAAPRLWLTLQALAERAHLAYLPTLYYVPSPVANAFAVGNADACAIALSDGLLRQLSRRELAGVLAHEISHIAHGDLRVMGLADFLSRLTNLLSLTGMLLLLAALPMMVLADIAINWPALLLLLFAPQLALLAQMGLSRVREFDADMAAVALTGDPEGLAAALSRIDRASRGWRAFLIPGLGNPEPSWLRSHPAIPERIRRLQTLERADRSAEADGGYVEWLPTAPGRSRWRPGGLWY